MPSLCDEAAAALDRLTHAGLRRTLRTVETAQGSVVSVHGREVVNFSSNDYLGLASCEAVKQAFIEGIERFGAGAGASRLVCGNQPPHEELEATLASFKGTEAALAFSSGYATALGVIPALVGESDVVILDKLCHASLIDAAKLSGATLRIFPHNHLEKLERLLASIREKSAHTRVLIVTESIFSMDGDAALLREIVDIKERFGAWLLLDEAHAIGLLGPQGRGLAAELRVADRIELQMGTLGKAIGVSGGYVACSRPVRDLLVNKARSFIYSTAPPPATAWAARAAVELAAGHEGDALRARLAHGKTVLLQGIPFGLHHAAAIVPLLVGDENEAMQASARLLEAGFLIPAIRYPTVARGAARLRLTLSAAHEAVQIERLVARLGDCVPQLFAATQPPLQERA
ncbi:MAG: 8-amino-7-oxononanoate synthase [Roseimicrobium sp.]